MKPTGLIALLALGAQGLALPVPSSPILESRISENDLLALISRLFPINVTLQAAGTAIAAAEQALAVAAGFQSTRNDLENGVCGDLLVIFARGTDEPGNVGVLVGPPLFNAIEAALKSGHTLAVQGVNNYDATVPEYLEGGDPKGSQDMASQITQAFSDCPKSKIVLGGYSQGGQIVHNAAKLLPAATMQAVSSVVIFGDPDSTQSVANVPSSKVLITCHAGDDICQDGDIIGFPHLTYSEDAGTAAAFVVSQAGL